MYAIRLSLLAGLVLAAPYLPSLMPAAAADTPVATVGSVTITEVQLEQHVKSGLVEVEMQRYEVLKEGLDELVVEALLDQEAKARGMSRADLEKQEIEAKSSAPTDADVQKLFDDNKDQLGGQTLEQIKPRIVEYLTQQKKAERATAYVDELKKKYKTTVNLRPPTVEVGTGSLPPRGNEKAKVTIVEFSDYECPFCKKAEASVDEVMKAYGDKVRLYYRDFPLPFHQSARPAAEAARCANAQGKFWPYHAKLMASSDLSKDKLKALATESGIDPAKLEECIAKGADKAAIDKDIADGSAAGVTGTPAFFINGRMLSGAQPFEKFKEVIDEELAR